MDEKRKGEIAYAILKRVTVRETSLKGIADTRRNIGNTSKGTGISEEELLQFGEELLREVFEEQMRKGFGPRIRTAN